MKRKRHKIKKKALGFIAISLLLVAISLFKTFSFAYPNNEEKTKKSVDKDKGQVEYTSQGARYTLSVTLIFDESDEVIYAEHSVSKQMEGFIAAISNPATSNIIFTWGNMSYEGYLESIDGKYVMFNKEGMPVRGQAELSIICTGISGESQISPQNPFGMWKGAYEDIIKDNKSEKGTGLFEFMK